MLYEGGMQKMLASVEATGGPPVVTPVAGEPVSKIVRATSAVVKAPEVRCPQLVKLVTVAQSAFMLAGLHCTGRHGAPLHVLHGGPGWHAQAVPDGEPLHVRANEFVVLFLQKPQKTLL